MFHSRRLPALNRHQRITPGRAYPRFLTAIKGTPTPIYVLKLSSDPPITEVPCTQDRSCSSRLFVSRYTYAISSASAAYTRGLCHAVQFRTSQSPDFHRFTCQQGWSALLQFPFPCRPTSCRLAVIGSNEGCHPRRPFQPHQPALPGMQLRRCAKGWLPSACLSTCVCSAVGGLLAEPSLQAPMGSPSRLPCMRAIPTSDGSQPFPHCLPYFV